MIIENYLGDIYIYMLKPIMRMEILSNNLKKYKDVQCLLGLGSMSQIRRADAYSDMDFFLIVKNGTKKAFMDDLNWLAVKPIVYQFRNSLDGYKILYEDGVYAEFAIFTEEEIVSATFTKGVIYYKSNDFDPTLVNPNHAPKPKKVDIEFNVNEALTNLYIGLLRLKRGEISSSTTFIQTYAYNLILPLFDTVYKRLDPFEDPFVFERRIEFRYKEMSSYLPKFRQGYNKNKASAKEMLSFLYENFDLNQIFLAVLHELL